MGDNRPPVYYEGNQLIIRTSAIGSSCMWELVAAGQGYELSEVPSNLQRAFDAGNQLEPVIIGMLEKEGYTITGQQDEGDWEVAPGITIRYHPDGFISPDTVYNPRILEVKALSDVLWQKAARSSVGECIDEYAWQLSVMMIHQNMPATWVAFNKGNADGTPCPDQGRLLFENHDTPIISPEDIIAKALEIRELVEGEDILMSGRECDDPSNYPCRFLYIRPEPEGRTFAEMAANPDDEILYVDGDEAEEVDRLTRDYLMFKGQMDESKQRMDDAKNRLIEIANGKKKIVTERWAVPVVNGSNSSPDYASMPQELKDELAKYKKVTSYKYLRGIKNMGMDDEG